MHKLIQNPCSLMFAVLVGLMFNACETNGPDIKNPFPNGKDTQPIGAVIIEYKGLRQSKRFSRSSVTLIRPKSP